MVSERPDPDQLLSRVREEEARSRRGRLKVFLGYAAGVGKTYAMLEEARREKNDGIDVVVGYVEPHGRKETEALLEGLEALPHRHVPYQGVTLREFDLDSALKRKPALILVDELAHTNAEGLRHAKRWQDVEELLEAGINVYTTLNIQHVESLNDVIAQVTGVVVRETLPDSVLEKADELELVDITPEDLMERLREGKVYLPAQAERALQHFFQKGNLVALREIALRKVATRLRREVDAARSERAAQTPWATSERLLVCVGPSPNSARLIRHAKRMADAFGAEWLAVAVQAFGEGARAEAARERIVQHLRLAEQLGAEAHVLVGRKVASTVLEYARARNVTKIIAGKTDQPRWKRLLFGTLIDELMEQSGDIDVYIIKGEGEATRPAAEPTQSPSPFPWDRYVKTAAVVLACGVIGGFLYGLELSEANVVMVFLLGVALVAARYGRGPAIFASIANVAVFDFFFVQPTLTLTVNDAQYLLTFGVLLGIGILISTLTARLRDQLEATQGQERRSAFLYRLTKQLSEVSGTEFLVRTAGHQVGEVFPGEVVLFLKEEKGLATLRFGESTSVAKQEINRLVAQWVADHGQAAGLGTDTLPNGTALFVPLSASQACVGALGIRPQKRHHLSDPEQRRLLEACASLIALAIERDQSVLEAHQAQVRMEAEQLRNSLLSSVSHDLRTPLAAIAGSASSLLENHLRDEERHELMQSIVGETQRLSRLVDNLLDMTRLQSAPATLNKQWHVLEEIIGSARNHLKRELVDRAVHVHIADDVPLLQVDGILLEQVFVNLLENAARYTPPGSDIDVNAEQAGKTIHITVADRGPGLPPGTEGKIFEKFYRGVSEQRPDQRRGVGLGLAICRAIVEAHQGHIEARNRPGGGAEFHIQLPARQAPSVPQEITTLTGALP